MLETRILSKLIELASPNFFIYEYHYIPGFVIDGRKCSIIERLRPSMTKPGM